MSENGFVIQMVLCFCLFALMTGFGLYSRQLPIWNGKQGLVMRLSNLVILAIGATCVQMAVTRSPNAPALITAWVGAAAALLIYCMYAVVVAQIKLVQDMQAKAGRLNGY